MSPAAPPSIAPWLAVSDAQKAVDYYKVAFGAVELYRLPADDGSLAVARNSRSEERCSGSRPIAAPALSVVPDRCV